MEEEAEKLKEMQKQVEQSIMSPTASGRLGFVFSSVNKIFI